jgi:hypothetical protein
MISTILMKPLFQMLVRIEKKLDEVMRYQKDNSSTNLAPGWNLTQTLNQPGQHPCGLCQQVPIYRNVQVPVGDGSSNETVTIRVCGCEPHIEDATI